MRLLIVISTDYQVRSVLPSGALDLLNGSETFYVASARGVTDTRPLEATGSFLGTVPESPARAKHYSRIRTLLLTAYRSRSRTIAAKLRLRRARKRTRRVHLRLPGATLDVRADLRMHAPLDERLAALPGVRSIAVRRHLRAAGLHPELHALVEQVQPDLVVATSAGVDDLAVDAVRSAREIGAESLVIVVNWDNLSSKGTFAVKPDHIAVWGEQTKEHATRIHRIPAERVAVLGVPTFDAYFRHVPGSTSPPFDFPYVLFAGCFAPFDERSALERLEGLIEREGYDLTVVYRPHPVRAAREVSDLVDEDRFRHVVIDPQVRPDYLAREGHRRLPKAERPVPTFPPLEYYPALLENARFVVCPLSTMIVESAIFERRVAVIAYGDEIHENLPATVIDYEHFDGIREIDGFDVCSSPEELDAAFLRLARAAEPPRTPMREQIGQWVFHDDRSTYAERLAALVNEIAERQGVPGPVPRVESTTPGPVRVNAVAERR